MMHAHSRIPLLAAAAAILAAGTALAQEVRYGADAPLGDGVIRTYVLHDADGKPAELGVAISETAMATLPDLSQKPPMESFLSLDLALPEGAPAPFQFVLFDWNSIGHPPVGVYTVPHFDFHFYTIPVDAKNAILPGETDVPNEHGEFAEGPFAERAGKAPTAGFLPGHYAYAPGSAVPQMGGHWVDPGSHEFHGQTFDKTFLYGTWDGDVIFVEPMITRAYIESKPTGTYEISLPESVGKPGWYPTAYSVRHDAEAQEYRIYLTGFEERN